MRLEYDVRVDGRVVGTYQLEDDGAELRQRIAFEQPDGAWYRDEHLVRHEDGRAVAYRSGSSPWTSLSAAPADHWPTAAFPLLLRAGVTTYVAIDEGTGETAPRTLTYTSTRVVERQHDQVTRVFDLHDGELVRIDWGEAVSVLLEAPERRARADGD